MTEEILTLAAGLCGVEGDRAALETLCAAVCRELDGMLAEGVTAEQCREPYMLAAAWLMADRWQAGRDGQGITAFSAGDMTVHRSPAAGRPLEERALALLAPWCRDRGFVFLGVRG